MKARYSMKQRAL